MEAKASAKIPVVNFMVLRAPTTSAEGFDRNWIRDDVFSISGILTHVPPRDADSVVNRSSVVQRIYQKVFCEEDATLKDLMTELIALLPAAKPRCPTNGDSEGDGAGGTPPLLIEDLAAHPYLEIDGTYHLIPDTLESYLKAPMMIEIMQARSLLRSLRKPFDRTKILAALQKIFRSSLVDVVFTGNRHSDNYKSAKRTLFDALYLLYVLRRRTSVNLEEIIDGLGVLHALEAMAIDQLCELVATKNATPEQEQLLLALAARVPQLKNWDGALAPGLPLIRGRADVRACLEATPIVHPLISRLFRFRRPFNDIKPIGIGDLKVVKQWLTGYEVGEIAYIENVLLSEHRSRVHRRLEKSEDSLTFASEQQSETTRDTQTTDRFELKREAEKVVKTDLGLNAGLSVNVSTEAPGYSVVANVTGGFAYARSATESLKLASTFARDVVDKAVSKVESRTSQSRTTVKTFETEETNRHQYDNREGTGHISGIYRWIDKQYKCQVYNFGKRMMFEFVLPEPAAFLIQARLAEYEGTLNMPPTPQKPTPLVLPEWLADLDPATIDENQFNLLSKSYDLTNLSFPTRTKYLDFIDSATGRNYFTESWVDSSTWQARTYTCRADATGYRITKLLIDGYVHFWGANEDTNAHPQDKNTFRVWIDGYPYLTAVDNTIEHWYYGANKVRAIDVAGAPAVQTDQVTLTLGFWDPADFDLSFHAELELGPQTLLQFQQQVYDKIRDIEQAKVDKTNADAYQTYQADLATYRNRIDDLQSIAIADLLQGKTEAFNRRIILRELKRQCISMLTRELDSDETDDIWSDVDATGTRSVAMDERRFTITAGEDKDGKAVTTAEFQETTRQLDIVVPRLAESKVKGQVVQFLEQAFEWPQLSYLPYAYFWAPPPRWVELMSQTDRTDPFLTDFLQAGSVRVLLAAAPAYNGAVLHYLATGEPWEGGPSPAIGDPLFMPLYEELRGTQDDIVGATPEGAPWTFTLPTSLVYLENSSTPLPTPDE